jgi:hypothetical protein
LGRITRCNALGKCIAPDRIVGGMGATGGWRGISLADLAFVDPDPESAEWLEMYRHWLQW